MTETYAWYGADVTDRKHCSTIQVMFRYGDERFQVAYPTRPFEERFPVLFDKMIRSYERELAVQKEAGK